MIHILKCWPPFFKLVRRGMKRHDIRVHDRDYMVGDYLALREWYPEKVVQPPTGEWSGYTGEVEIVHVTYVTPPLSWGIPVHITVMSFERCTG